MPSLMDTGFVSKKQEDYMKINEPSLYKAIVKKHGHYGKAKNYNVQPRTNNVKMGR